MIFRHYHPQQELVGRRGSLLRSRAWWCRTLSTASSSSWSPCPSAPRTTTSLAIHNHRWTMEESRRLAHHVYSSQVQSELERPLGDMERDPEYEHGATTATAATTATTKQRRRRRRPPRMDWTAIACHLPGRTAASCEQHWNQLRRAYRARAAGASDIVEDVFEDASPVSEDASPASPHGTHGTTTTTTTTAMADRSTRSWTPQERRQFLDFLRYRFRGSSPTLLVTDGASSSTSTSSTSTTATALATASAGTTGSAHTTNTTTTSATTTKTKPKNEYRAPRSPPRSARWSREETCALILFACASLLRRRRESSIPWDAFASGSGSGFTTTTTATATSTATIARKLSRSPIACQRHWNRVRSSYLVQLQSESRFQSQSPPLGPITLGPPTTHWIRTHWTDDQIRSMETSLLQRHSPLVVLDACAAAATTTAGAKEPTGTVISSLSPSLLPLSPPLSTRRRGAWSTEELATLILEVDRVQRETTTAMAMATVTATTATTPGDHHFWEQVRVGQRSRHACKERWRQLRLQLGGNLVGAGRGVGQGGEPPFPGLKEVLLSRLRGGTAHIPYTSTTATSATTTSTTTITTSPIVWGTKEDTLLVLSVLPYYYSRRGGRAQQRRISWESIRTEWGPDVVQVQQLQRRWRLVQQVLPSFHKQQPYHKQQKHHRQHGSRGGHALQPWREEEVELLRAAVHRYRSSTHGGSTSSTTSNSTTTTNPRRRIPWQEVSRLFNGRSAQACLLKWKSGPGRLSVSGASGGTSGDATPLHTHTHLHLHPHRPPPKSSYTAHRAMWTEEEDLRLLQGLRDLVRDHQRQHHHDHPALSFEIPGNAFAELSCAVLPHRTAKQIANRFRCHLDPRKASSAESRGTGSWLDAERTDLVALVQRRRVVGDVEVDSPPTPPFPIPPPTRSWSQISSALNRFNEKKFRFVKRTLRECRMQWVALWWQGKVPQWI